MSGASFIGGQGKWYGSFAHNPDRKKSSLHPPRIFASMAARPEGAKAMGC